MIDSRVYRIVDVTIRLLLLNLVWLLACLPVITAFPATAALFGVIREWARHEENGIVGPFFRQFRQHFRQSLAIGVTWAIVGAVLAVDLLALRRMALPFRLMLPVLAGTVGLCYLFASLYIFPVMVSYRTTWRGVIRNAFLIAVSQPTITLLGLALVAIALAAFFLAPATLLVSGSVTAYFLSALCDRAFQRVAEQQGIRQSHDPEGDG